MNYELIKATILTILVLTSFALTWKLWDYQPDYEVIESGKYIQNVSISDKKVAPDTIVRPNSIFVHKKSEHFRITLDTDVNRFLKDMKGWAIEDIEDVSTTVTREQFLPLVYGEGRIELVYGDTFSFTTYQNIIQARDKGSNIMFDRIVFPLENNPKSFVYFISYENRQVYQATIKTDLSVIKKQYYDHATTVPYVEYKINNVHSVFVPKDPLVMSRLQYYTNDLDPEKFRDVLFNAPVVKRDSLSFGDQYTDGSRVMNVYIARKTLSYESLNVQTGLPETEPNLLERSIEFVNDHGGWTGSYRFDGLNTKLHQTTFRLYANNYPVFNELEMATIQQTWGKTEIINYKHPLFTLEVSDRTPFPITLPKGEEVLNQLKSLPIIQMQNIQSFTAGYTIINSADQEQVVTLSPAWFFLYQNAWQRVILKENKDKGWSVIGFEQEDSHISK